MLIKHKLLLNTFLIIVGLAALFTTLIVETDQLQVLADIRITSEKLKGKMLTLRRNEKDFLARKDVKYLDKFNKNYATLAGALDHLIEFYSDKGFDTSEFSSLDNKFKLYSEMFNRLVQLQVVLGTDHKSGIQGQLRSAAHKLESHFINAKNYKALSDYLTLRRHEKDFLQRHEMKYNSRLIKLVQNLKNDIPAAARKSLALYSDSFANLVHTQQQMGLEHDQGLLGELRSTVQSTEQALDNLDKQIEPFLNKTVAGSKQISTIIFSIIVIALVSASFVLGRTILQPVEKLHYAISDIYNSNDLSKRANLAGNDEIAMTGKSFDQMLSNFQDLIKEVNNTISTLSSAAQALTDNASSTSDGMTSQLNETDMVATAVTEMGSTIDEIASNTEAAASRAEKTSENAQAGQRGVEQTISRINQLADSLTESSDAVGKLEEESETIGQVLDVIRGIAEQTNLLALNAAIEAARAGEQGRGFAVVADEVRNLAMRTQESTQEIAKIIDSLQNRTGSIVELIKNCHNQGQESTEQAQQAGELLQQITRDVANISDTSTQIAAAIEQQSKVANEVNQNIVNIRDIAETSNQAATNTSTASNEILTQADMLSSAVQKFKV